MRKIFLLYGLDCPNCSAKIEKEVADLSDITFSSVNLMKQTLTVDIISKDVGNVIKTIENIVHSHEPEVEFSEYVEPKNQKPDNENRILVIRLIFGALLFAAALLISKLTDILWIYLAALITAYTVLGFDVVFKALKNIVKGKVFDENFLMSISTVGAFLIGEYPEAVAVMLFYQVGEFFQNLAVHRSRRSISELMDIRPDSVNVIRDGSVITVSPETVSVGEIILVKPGEKLPLDGVIVEGDSTLDTGALTGESKPQSVTVDNEVFSGCINQTGVLKIRVTKKYADSTVAKIIDLVENSAAKKAPTENFIAVFARYYTPIVVILAALLAVVPSLIFGGWADWIHRGFVFLVVSCPCALVISIPLTFFGGIGAASKHGILIKGSNYLEALSKLSTVVFDKTGTLTKGEFSVTEIKEYNGFSKDRLLQYAAKAESLSNHPVATSVVKEYAKDIDTASIQNFKEISGKGVSAEIDGNIVLAGNAKLMQDNGVKIACSYEDETVIYVAVNGVFAGRLNISDSIKADSKKCIDELKKAGVKKTVMLTGDNENIAEHVSKTLGIDVFYAKLLPSEKVEKLEEIDKQKPENTKLAFVGDGINDAPVLARADIGIAMGALGSDAAIEAADVVLMTDGPSKIPEAVKIANATKRIVLQNILIALGVKGIFLVLGAFGIAGMWEAVFGDVGVALIAVFNAMRALKIKVK